MTKDEALKIAIENLWECSMLMNLDHSDYLYEDVIQAYDACKEALEQPASLGDFNRMSKEECVDYIEYLRKEIDLLTFKKWQGLTEDEIEYWECLKAPPVHPDFLEDDSWREFARCIEQALRIKNDYQS